MRSLSLALVVTLGVAACSSGDTVQQDEQTSPKASARAEASAKEAGAVAKAESDTNGAQGSAWGAL